MCANHLTFNDPVILIAVLKRRLTFLAKAELFKNKLFAWVFRRMGAIPISRGAADIAAFRAGMNALKSGAALGVFLTGHRMREFDENAVKAGAALFAHKSGAPVIPVGITAGYRLFSRVTINIGAPVDLSDYLDKRAKSEDLNEMARRITEHVKKLLV